MSKSKQGITAPLAPNKWVSNKQSLPGEVEATQVSSATSAVREQSPAHSKI